MKGRRRGVANAGRALCKEVYDDFDYIARPAIPAQAGLPKEEVEMCQPVALCQPIALPPDYDGVDMIALAKTVTQPCTRCGHKHDGVGVIVRDGSVLCQRCGFNSQPRVAAMLKHRRRAAAKVKRRRRAAAKQPERVRVMPMPTSTPRPREHRAAPRGRDGGERDDGSGGDSDSDGGGGGEPPSRSRRDDPGGAT